MLYANMHGMLGKETTLQLRFLRPADK